MLAAMTGSASTPSSSSFEAARADVASPRAEGVDRMRREAVRAETAAAAEKRARFLEVSVVLLLLVALVARRALRRWTRENRVSYLGTAYRI